MGFRGSLKSSDYCNILVVAEIRKIAFSLSERSNEVINLFAHRVDHSAALLAGHTSAIPWTLAIGPEELPALEAMKSHSFHLTGSTRSYWDFYFGWGLILSLYTLVQTVMSWQLGSLAKTDSLRVRGMIASFFVLFIEEGKGRSPYHSCRLSEPSPTSTPGRSRPRRPRIMFQVLLPNLRLIRRSW